MDGGVTRRHDPYLHLDPEPTRKANEVEIAEGISKGNGRDLWRYTAEVGSPLLQ